MVSNWFAGSAKHWTSGRLFIIPHKSEVYLGMAMVENERARAMVVVWPGPTSLTAGNKAQTRS